ncbi:unnamed protein product, partial [Ectocarpus fasciculatus]
RFTQAAQVVNSLPEDKFPRLLNRIFSKLHIKNARIFSEEEEGQMKNLFGLTDDSLKLVIDGCSYIFEQAAFQGLGPEPMFEVLLEAGFESPHAKALGRLWAAERIDFVNKLKQRTLGAAALVGTDYHMNITVAESTLSKLQESTALFDFTISNPSHESQNDKLCMELSHPELFSFFQQLETVQQQLDSLGGTASAESA